MDADALIDEGAELRRQCRSLQHQINELKQDPQRVREMLVAMDSRLDACATAEIFPSHPTPLQQELMRAVRSRAALLALRCMAIMQRCSSAVLPSALVRVHVGALRPREAGGKDPAADAVVPAICRLFFRSRLGPWLPTVGAVLLWLIGVTCHFLVFFDWFEPGSTHEWGASTAGALMLPVIACIGASLNAKTAQRMLKEFETLYVLAYVLGMVCLSLFLFRDRPAKMAALSCATPSFVLSGFLDAFPEGGRLLNSRTFFVLNVASLLLYMALVSLKLGAYADYTFQVGTFGFVASSMVCNSIATLLVFGVKNIALSFYEPGSLVVLVSAVCCVFLDADALAVLKGAYSLIGQSLGKYAPNKTIETYLKRQRLSMVEFSQQARARTTRGVVSEPTHELEEESEPSIDARLIIEDVTSVDIPSGGTDVGGGVAVSGAADGGGFVAGFPPFALPACGT